MDRFVLVKNVLACATFGGIYGATNTLILIATFTTVSTNRFMNFYIGGLFMVFGALLLHRVCKRRGMVSADVGRPKKEGAADLNEDENESLLLEQDKAIYKGGIGADILHDPLLYKDSYMLPAEWNESVNSQIKMAEYGMSLGKILSGILCLTLEKHNFKYFDDHYKVPIYMVVGSSLSFLIIYALFDVIELCKNLYHTAV